MNGTTIGSVAVVGNIPSTWTIAGAADFNGNNKTDIVWRETGGNVAVWLMNGTTVSAATVIGNIPPSWSIAVTGDFNGDGMGDIMWRDSSGTIALWQMSGTTSVVLDHRRQSRDDVVDPGRRG